MDALDSISQTDWAYIAGIIDGEGHICVNKTYQLRIQVRTTSKALSEWLHNKLQCGTVRAMQDKRELENGGRRAPCYEWRVFTKQALQVLEAIQPYIVIKQNEVNTAIEFQRLEPTERRRRGEEFRAEIQGMHLPAQRTVCLNPRSSDSCRESDASQPEFPS